MMEYIQASYNVHEHNHTEKDEGQLNARLEQLAGLNQDWQSAGRRAQVQREMSIIAFECAERQREAKNQQIEEAWSEHAVV